jgi:hypothetical protein
LHSSDVALALRGSACGGFVDGERTCLGGDILGRDGHHLVRLKGSGSHNNIKGQSCGLVNTQLSKSWPDAPRPASAKRMKKKNLNMAEEEEWL